MKTTVVRWTCDICGIIAETDSEPPLGWATLRHLTKEADYHFSDFSCYEQFLSHHPEINNETWSLYIQSNDPVSSVWPKNPVEE